MSEKSIFSEIGLARILRYSYGGILLILLAAVINPSAVSPIVDALGTILTPIAALGLGAGIYVIHRYVIGEIFLYPLLHFLHYIWDRVRRRSGIRSTDTTTYLEALGVRKEDSRAAYTAVRRSFIESDIRGQLDIAHSELHML